MAKKTTTKTTEVSEPVKEEVAVVEKEVVDNTPKRYYVDFYLKKEPIAKDEKIGTIFYSDTTESIEIEGLMPNYSSDIEQIMLGNITFMDGVNRIYVSRYEDLKNWTLNLHRVKDLGLADPNLCMYASEATITNEIK
tara:strand:- start:6195 stop:6605 length:411 start_codon:yes stop_codon:yes gene_type:complete